MGGVLAIDFGTRKCGFAYADPQRIVVRALEGLRHEGREARLLDHVTGLCGERDVTTVLLGMPTSDERRPGDLASRVEAFAGRLRQRHPELTIALQSEHLTTKEAESLLREAGYDSRDIPRLKDSWAALVLLREWLGAGEPPQTA